MQAWHYHAPPRTLFVGINWSGECVTGKLLAYGQPTDKAQPLGLWAWAEITQQWQPGLGERL